MIVPDNGDNINKAIARGDDFYHLLGTTDDIATIGVLDIPSTCQGVYVGGFSDMDRFILLWEDPSTSPGGRDSALISPGCPFVGRIPVGGTNVFSFQVLSLRATNLAIMAAGAPPGLVEAAKVDLYFALRPGLSLPTRRAPGGGDSGAVTSPVSSVVSQIYTYGRKTIFAAVNNVGAVPVTVTFVGRSINNAAPGSVVEVTLGSSVVAVGSSTVLNISNDSSYDALRVYAVSPAGAGSVAFRLEARDEF